MSSGVNLDTARDRVYIITPVYNRVATTVEFADLLTGQSNQNFQLILVDDGSTDGTSERVREKLPDLKLIRGDGGLWWAGCLQEAFKWLKSKTLNPGDCVVILNDDTKFDEHFIENGRNLIKGNPGSLLIAECYLAETGKNFDRGVYFNDRKFTFRPAKNDAEINCASTRGLFMAAGDFLEIGGFHPKLLPHYLSDYEFTIRAVKKGYRIITHPDVKVWTSGNTSGIDEFKKGDFWGSMKTMLFSKLYRRNPVYSSVFILMACRLLYSPKLIFMVWVQETGRLFSVLPAPVYGLLRLVLLPVFHLFRSVYIYLRTVVIETIASIRLIIGSNG